MLLLTSSLLSLQQEGKQRACQEQHTARSAAGALDDTKMLKLAMSGIATGIAGDIVICVTPGVAPGLTLV